MIHGSQRFMSRCLAAGVLQTSGRNGVTHEDGKRGTFEDAVISRSTTCYVTPFRRFTNERDFVNFA